jgi:hypothetical protein
VSMELCQGYAMHPTHYSLSYCQDGSEHVPRNWEFQGSMDGRTWHVLRRHRNDTSLEDFSRRAAWPIIDEALLDDDHLDSASGSPGGLGLFRFFRVMQVTDSFVCHRRVLRWAGGRVVSQAEEAAAVAEAVAVLYCCDPTYCVLLLLFLRGGQCLRPTTPLPLMFVVVGCLSHALCSLSALLCAVARSVTFNRVSSPPISPPHPPPYPIPRPPTPHRPPASSCRPA